ncbi:hypothetical protein DFH09DRAFT_1084319 [Mycena vulgaris]|nr:hypothetical protein DFH09DRAFT_1084319 [Mycena vulgaris]
MVSGDLATHTTQQDPSPTPFSAGHQRIELVNVRCWSPKSSQQLKPPTFDKLPEPPSDASLAGIVSSYSSDDSSKAFLFWDHILTLDTEIHFLWKRRKFASAYSFFAIRYFAFTSNIPGAAFLFFTIPTNVFVVFKPNHSPICLLWSVIYEIAILLVQFSICVIMIPRIYALYGRNKRVLWFLLTIGVGCTFVAVWSTQGQHATTITGQNRRSLPLHLN